MPTGEYLQYGGQAIIEGVMMRSPHHFSVAVRAPNGEIVVRCEPLEKTWIGRQKWLKLPFLRGTLGILDAMALGYRALKFAGDIQLDPKYAAPTESKEEGSDESGEGESPSSATVAAHQPAAAEEGGESVPATATVAVQETEVQSAPQYTDLEEEPPTPEDAHEPETSEEISEEPKKMDSLSSIAVVGALIAGLAIGVFLFNYLPNLLAVLAKGLGIKHPIAVNFTTEIIKVIFFLGYLYLISLMGEIRRLFQYHGAEHKAINVLEADQELTMENCKAQTRLHPRCGTSFAIIVLIVGMILFTFMPKPEIASSVILTSIARFLVELPLLPVIAGISYEAIRLAGKMKNKKLVMALFWPGLMTQYITTKEPDESQIEVSIAALQAVIDADKAKLAAEAA